MRKIAVTGGKGGTGKSTFAVLLALKQVNEGKKVLLIDCDVECPNDYLLLGQKELRGKSKTTKAYYPQVDPKKCSRCGLCTRSCESNAIFTSADKLPIINETLCSSCGVCWNICPQNAISKRSKPNGKIFFHKVSRNLHLLTGQSIPGVRETSPVVKETRKYAEKKARKYNTIIIDTAAGTHCTVMAALEGADEAYAVTEPTPLGAHDLKLILEVLKVMKIPAKVIVNQFDIGKLKLIEKSLKKYEANIAAKIPYSKEIAETYSRGGFIEDKDLLNLVQ